MYINFDDTNKMIDKIDELTKPPLWEDQIHTPAWQKLCHYIWAEKEPRDYELGVKEHHNPNIELINADNPPGYNGIIFIGMCHLFEQVMAKLPRDGSYIVVHRTNDRPFTSVQYESMPPSVKHVYTVDCRGIWPNVTAIPFGCASIMGEDEILKEVARLDDDHGLSKRRIFACYNINGYTHHRKESLKFVKNSDLVTWKEPQIGQYEFHLQCRRHEFVMALAGCGADASRQWSAMTLGSIPIVTYCTEMIHFEDMPLVYCPPFDQLTNEWLDEAKKSISSKSTERLRMSYWESDLKKRRFQLW